MLSLVFLCSLPSWQMHYLISRGSITLSSVLNDKPTFLTWPHMCMHRCAETDGHWKFVYFSASFLTFSSVPLFPSPSLSASLLFLPPLHVLDFWDKALFCSPGSSWGSPPTSTFWVLGCWDISTLLWFLFVLRGFSPQNRILRCLQEVLRGKQKLQATPSAIALFLIVS